MLMNVCFKYHFEITCYATLIYTIQWIKKKIGHCLMSIQIYTNLNNLGTKF